MAQPVTLAFGKFLIELGSGSSPETFAAPCGLTSKGLSITAGTQDTTVPDCDNPDAPAWTERAVDAIAWEISGSGVLAMEYFDEWRTWLLAAAPKNVRIRYNTTALNNGGYWAGRGILTAFNNTADRGQKINVEVTITGDGALTWVPAA